MKDIDIADETLKVGHALTSVRLDQMIVSLARGIAWGQYDLDKVGMDITKMMGVPGTVSIGKEKLSMLDAGFIPSFYHFVDTMLELKMEINIREETTESKRDTTKNSYSTMVERSSGSSSSRSASINVWGIKAGAESKSSSSSKAGAQAAYSRTIDATHSQKYSQDLSATSLMRTKLVPKPAPEVLIERIKLLLERLKEEAKTEAKTDDPEDIFNIMMEKISTDFI